MELGLPRIFPSFAACLWILTDRIVPVSAVLLGKSDGDNDDDANNTLSWRFHKLHGGFMAVAWTSVIPTALFCARYMRRPWPRGWFQVHRALMIFGISLVTLGLFFILYAHKGKFSVEPHSVCGILTISLVYAQPLIAFLRPHAEVDGIAHPRRWIFNWVHRSVGVLSFLLAVVSMFLGCNMLGVIGLPATLAVPGFFVLLVAISVVLGELVKQNVVKIDWSDLYEVPNDDSDDELLDLSGSSDYTQRQGCDLGVRSICFWSTFFGVFVASASTLAAVLVGCIASTSQNGNT